GGGEGAPAFLGDDDIGGLLAELGDELHGLGRKAAGDAARRFGAAGNAARDIVEDHRQVVTAKGRREGAGSREYRSGGVGGAALGIGADTLLQVEDDERSPGIEGGYGHGFWIRVLANGRGGRWHR